MKGLLTGTITIIMVAALGVAGCGGGGADVRSEHSTYTTTLGQELKDLEDAYKKGIITEKQYETSKEKLLKQRTEQ